MVLDSGALPAEGSSALQSMSFKQHAERHCQLEAVVTSSTVKGILKYADFKETRIIPVKSVDLHVCVMAVLLKRSCGDSVLDRLRL